MAQIHILTTVDSWHPIAGKLNLADCAPWELLPNQNNNITSAIILCYYQLLLMHGGTELVLSLIRQKLWTINRLSAVKKKLRKCILSYDLCTRLPGHIFIGAKFLALPKHLCKTNQSLSFFF